MPCSQTPAGPLRLTVEETLGAGSSCCRRLSPRRIGFVPVPQSVPWSCLAASRRSVVAFRHSKGVGSHDDLDFEAQSHGLFTRCLRFAAFLPPQRLYGHAKLAAGWWSTLAGWDWLPTGSHREVSAFSTSASSSPKLCLAQWNVYPLWSQMAHARDLRFDACDPIRLGAMTEGLLVEPGAP